MVIRLHELQSHWCIIDSMCTKHPEKLHAGMQDEKSVTQNKSGQGDSKLSFMQTRQQQKEPNKMTLMT